MPCTARSPTAPPPSYQRGALAAAALEVARRAEGHRGHRPVGLGDAEVDRRREHPLGVLVLLGHVPSGGLPFSSSNDSSMRRSGGGAVRPDDMIMVSVDDHLVEPPTMFDAHIPDEVPGPGAEGRAQGRRLRRVDVQRRRDPEHRAQRRRRPPQGGVRHRADRLRRDAAGLLGHRRAGQGHGRRRDPRLDVLPVLPRLLGPAVRGRRRQGPRPRRACRPTTTGTSTSGAAPRPGASSRWACPVLWDPELAAAEVRRLAKKGVHSVTFTENPATLGYPSFHSEHWDPLWRGAASTRTSCCRSTSARRASSPSPRPTRRWTCSSRCSR